MFLSAARQLLGFAGDIGAAAERQHLAQLVVAEHPELRRAAAREAADAVLAERESASLLQALAPLVPVVLKGVALAARWPLPRVRPAGDLDLLLEESSLPGAVTTLRDLGYRVSADEPGGWLRPLPTGVELIAPEGHFVNVDLHTRPFRSVGGRIDGAALLSRARPGELLGKKVRFLDPADEVLYLLVHAAKHGACAPKWLLDLWVVTQRFDEWPALIERARAAGVTRPAWAAARLLAELPGARLPATVLASLRPSLPVRILASALVRPGDSTPRWERYARELALEESAWSRLRMLSGVAERIIREPSGARRGAAASLWRAACRSTIRRG